MPSYALHRLYCGRRKKVHGSTPSTSHSNYCACAASVLCISPQSPTVGDIFRRVKAIPSPPTFICWANHRYLFTVLTSQQIQLYKTKTVHKHANMFLFNNILICAAKRGSNVLDRPKEMSSTTAILFTRIFYSDILR
jgi:hypothetical protein